MNKTQKKNREVIRVIGIIAVLLLFGLMAVLNALQEKKIRVAANGETQQGIYSEKM